MVLHTSQSTEETPPGSISLAHTVSKNCSSYRPNSIAKCNKELETHDASAVENPSLICDMLKNTEDVSARNKKYIASLDVGTTIVRCFIFNKKAKLCAQSEEKVMLLRPKPGYVEMDPEEVWVKCRTVIKNAVEGVGIDSIISLGMCTQRCTFLLWDADTGLPLHNLITWKDIRADGLVHEWNNCLLMKSLRWGSRFLHLLTGNKRYQACSVLTFMNTQVILRLKWLLENCPQVEPCLAKGSLRFGTLDTWIVYKLTQGKVYATEFGNASCTAMFDPFLKEWSSFVMHLVGIPQGILPELRPSAGDWGCCSSSLFGAPLPITAVMSDQGASLAGGGGYERGHIKVTLGTGGFINLNTGQLPHSSVKGIYPVVAWQEEGGRVVYMAEGSSNDIGSVVEWGRSVGLYTTAAETATLAASVRDSAGVFFVPAFQGLQAPVNDSSAGCGFIGITARTSRPHLVRALLDSIVFLVYQVYQCMLQEAGYALLEAKVDGGVSQNALVLQQVSTLTNRPLTRYSSTELSGLGAAALAGAGAGVFSSPSELQEHLEVERVFEPIKAERAALLERYGEWQRAVQRFLRWQRV